MSVGVQPIKNKQTKYSETNNIIKGIHELKIDLINF